MNNSKELPTYENYLLGWNLMVDFIENNRDLEALGISQWYNARIVDVVYERDAEDRERERCVLTLECNVNEVIS